MHDKNHNYESRTEKMFTDNIQEIADWFVLFFFTYVDVLRDCGHLIPSPMTTAFGVLLW